MVIPLDFGFVPGTKGGDGDALDILVLMAEPTFCGCVVPTRLIGAIEAEQTQGGKTFRNDRLIGVALNQPMCEKVNSLKELDRKFIEQLKIFFVAYNEGQGRKFKPLRQLEAQAAKKLVEKYRVWVL
jgi:inorganic pyrophosphatase